MSVRSLLTAPLLTTLMIALAVSQGTAQDTIAVAYDAEVKAGMMAEFEAAVAAHAAWRSENDDPWTWTAYQVVNGENLNNFSFRSGGHTWADFDRYAAFNQEAAIHFRTVVGPYVESLTSRLIANTDVGRWTGSTTRPMYTVQTYQMKPGAMPDFLGVARQFTAALEGTAFEGEYIFQVVRNGGPGGVVAIVSPLDSWASMEGSGPSMQSVLVEQLGEDETAELWEQFNGSYRNSESSVVLRRPDLSVGLSN